MSREFQERVVFTEKWNVYKKQVQNGQEPNPSIHEILAEMKMSKSKKKQKWFDRFKENAERREPQEGEITEHKKNAIFMFHKQGRDLKDIAEVVGISPFLVVHVLTEKDNK